MARRLRAGCAWRSIGRTRASRNPAAPTPVSHPRDGRGRRPPQQPDHRPDQHERAERVGRLQQPAVPLQQRQQHPGHAEDEEAGVDADDQLRPADVAERHADQGRQPDVAEPHAGAVDAPHQPVERADHDQADPRPEQVVVVAADRPEHQRDGDGVRRGGQHDPRRQQPGVPVDHGQRHADRARAGTSAHSHGSVSSTRATRAAASAPRRGWHRAPVLADGRPRRRAAWGPRPRPTRRARARAARRPRRGASSPSRPATTAARTVTVVVVTRAPAGRSRRRRAWRRAARSAR